MQLMNEIPDTFWSLFRSVNRDIYIEALLCINEEYEYNNYFLTKEVCIQILSDMNAKKRFELQREENDTDFDMLETPSSRILNWLLRAGWLKRIEDYNTLVTNIVIPDYAAVMIDAFEKLNSEDASETDIYIQNVYATLYAFRNDPRASIGLLRTALVNTRRLNKALQDMLHNMNKFFAKLLQQDSYSGILREHLDSYVEEIVWKKYHILKTSDNFYIYKMDIKKCLREIRDDEAFIMKVQARSKMLGDNQEDVLDLLDLIERGFDDIEHRIMNMDTEHTKYIRATVTRLNYLLNQDDNMKGLVIQVLNELSGSSDEELEQKLTLTASKMNFSQFTVISDRSLYKRRKSRQDFAAELEPEEEMEELTRDEILQLNRMKNRYSRRQIRSFVLDRMEDGRYTVTSDTVSSLEDFEKLVLAYDDSVRKDSPYRVLDQEAPMVEHAGYRYPGLVFVRKE